jgi:hypothetical protein
MRLRSPLWPPLLPTLAVILASVSGCAGAGPYGHSAQYVPLSAEEHAAKGAKDYDPVMVDRQPEAWHAATVSLFGVVVARSPGPGGSAYLTLTVRRLEPRNLCEYSTDESSCRTTVSDRDFGVIHALTVLRPEDDIGEHSLGIGSLIRVIGKLSQDPDPTDGSPVLRPTYYRHWPRYFYVTRKSAETMRQ